MVAEVVAQVVSGGPTNDDGALDVGMAVPGVLGDEAYANVTSAAVDEEVSIDVVDVKTTKSATLRTPAALSVVGDDVVGTVRRYEFSGT